MKKLMVVIGFLIAFGNCYSQINLEWYKIQDAMYKDPSYYSIVTDSLDNVYSVCYILNQSKNIELLITKYNTAGILQWSKSHFIKTKSSSDNYFSSIKLFNGKIIVTYNLADMNDFNNIGILIYDVQGNLLKNLIYSYNVGWDSFINGAELDKIGNIYITGYVTTASGNNRIITLKFNSSATLVWFNILSVFSRGNDIKIDESGNVYVCGTSDSATTFKRFMLTIKYNSIGTLIWKKLSGQINPVVNGDDEGQTIHLDDSSNVIVGGSCYISNSCFTLVKYKPDGSLCWKTYYNNLYGVNLITSRPGGSIYASGYGEYFPDRIMKFNANGLLMSTYSSSNFSVNLIKCVNGKYIFAGGSMNLYTGSKSRNYFAILDTNLNTIKSHNFSIDTNCWNYYRSFDYNKNGNVYLSGVCYSNNVYPRISKISIVKISQTVGVQNIGSITPDKYSLSQNYPNPFNPSTNIRYSISSIVNRESSIVKLVVFDILGKEIATLVNEKQNAGTYEVIFDGSGLTSGIYFYKLTCGDFSEVKKMVLLK